MYHKSVNISNSLTEYMIAQMNSHSLELSWIFPSVSIWGIQKAIVHLNDKQHIIDACVRHIVVSSIAEELFSFRKGISSFGGL
jgi:hypothetical protein